MCRNPSLGLATEAKACKGVCQEGSMGVTFRAPGNVGECERSHSQVNSHFGNWNPNGFPNLQRAIARVKTH